MAITNRPKLNANESLVASIIDKGGSVAQQQAVNEDSLKKLSLRMSQSLIDEIDAIAKGRLPKVSRENWLREAVYEKLARDKG